MKIAFALLLVNLLYSFEYKETNPHSLFPYYYAVSDFNEFGHLSNPAYLPFYNAVYLSIDYGKPYLMKELNSGNVRAGSGFSNFGIQGAWNRFGIEEYSEDIFEGNFGFKPWKFFSTGIGVSYYRLCINTDELKYKHDNIDCKLALLLLPTDFLTIGYIQENAYSLVKKRYNKDNDILFSDNSFGVGLKPARGIIFSWNINRIYLDYINTFSVTANMLPSLSLKTGYSRETASYSLSINFIYGKLSASYGLSHQTYLGLTHKIGITLASSNFVFEEINYNKKLFRDSIPGKKKKININNSSVEELMDSRLFSKEISERIIKYRDAIGPISETGLIQIGYSKKEFKNSREFILGLAEEPVKIEKSEVEKTTVHNINKRSGYNIDTRKSFFQRLLESGLPAGTALKIAEQARNSNKTEILRFVNNISEIDNEKKKTIINICNELL